MKSYVPQEVRMAMAELRKARREQAMQPGCSTAMAHAAGKLGRTAMPKAESNDRDLKQGGRQKTPVRYE